MRESNLQKRRLLQLELLESRQLLAAGDPDLTFGDAGLATPALVTRELSIRPVAAEATPDGKTVVVGSRLDSNLREFNPFVAQIDASGNLDPDFSEVGYRFLNQFNETTSDRGVRDVDVDADGSIYVLRDVSGAWIYKLGPDGSPINDFQRNQDGFDDLVVRSLTPGSGFGDRPVALQVDDAGRIVVVGENSDGMATVIRLLPNGQFDQGFGESGRVSIPTTGTYRVGDVEVAGDGQIYVPGYLDGVLSVASVTNEGLLRTDFGVGGIVSLPVPASFFEFTEPLVDETVDGGIVIGGRSQSDSVIGLLRSDGMLDTSFDDDGIVVIDRGGTETLGALLAQADGSIALGVESTADTVVIELLADGSLSGTSPNLFSTRSFNEIIDLMPTGDGGLLGASIIEQAGISRGDLGVFELLGDLSPATSFSGDGQNEIELFDEDDFEAFGNSNPIVTQTLADGRILMISPQQAIRLTSTGELDTTYGDDGVSQPPSRISLGQSFPSADGSYLMVGSSSSGSSSIDTYLIDPSGNPDASFGSGGLISDGVGFSFRDAVMADDMSIYVLTRTTFSDDRGKIAVVRYLSDRTRDTSFGVNGVSLVEPPEDFEFRSSRISIGPDGDPVVAVQQFPLIAAATPERPVVLAKLDGATGNLVSGFGDNGILTTAFTEEVTGLTVDSDNSILLASEDNFDITTVRRFDFGGMPVTSFGASGVLRLDESRINGSRFNGEIAIDSVGNLLIPAESRSAIEVIRITSDGEIDFDFGTFGVASRPLSSVAEARGGVSFDGQGRLLTATVTDTDFADARPHIARFNNEPSPGSVAGRIRLSETFPFVDEEAGEAVIELIREGGSDGVVSVRVRTVTERDVEAQPGEDYTTVDQIIQFAPGQTRQEIRIPIIADSVDEAPETFRVEISEVTGGAILENPQAARATINRQGLNPVSLDPDFGTDGISVDVFGSRVPVVGEVIELDDGRIIVVGSDDATDGNVLVHRYTPDGQLDPTFSSDGRLRLDFNFENEQARDVIALPDGSLLVAGVTNFSVDAGVSQPRATLLRILPDGSVDTEFGRDGRVLDDDLRLVAFSEITASDDGGIFVLGELEEQVPDPDDVNATITQRSILLQKRTASGDIDPTFGNAGQIEISDVSTALPTNGRSLVQDESGRFYLTFTREVRIERATETGTVAAVSDRPTIAAVSAAGVLDTSFGTDGFAELDGFESNRVLPRGLALDADGNVVLAVWLNDDDEGSSSDFRNERAALLRVSTAGVRDTSFGDGGLAVFGIRFEDVQPLGVAVTPDGRLWMPVGTQSDGRHPDVGFVAFLSDGTPDPAIVSTALRSNPPIISTGFQPTDTRLSAAISGAITIRRGGEVLIAGSTETASGFTTLENQLTLTQLAGGVGVGELELSVSDIQVDENDGTAEVRVVRRGGASGRVTAGLQTSNGTATEGSDFTATDQLVVFEDGETTQVVNIPIFDDMTIEGPENFTVTLSNATGGATLGSLTTTEIEIVDGPGTIQFVSAFTDVAENQIEGTVILQRVGGSDGEVSVRVRSTGGTATAGTDFASFDEVVTFADGAREASFTFRLFDDPITEGIETIEMELSEPTGGAALGTRAQAQVDLFDVESFQTTNAGSIDLTFGNNGLTDRLPDPTVNLVAGFAAPLGIVPADGGGTLTALSNFGVVKHLADGSRDTSFGDDGIAITAIDSAGTESLRAESFAVDALGRTIVVGRRNFFTNSDIIAIRYLADGTVDTSFGAGGVANVDTGRDDRGFAVAIDPTGAIYVAGSSGGLQDRTQVVAKLTDDGELDSSFGTAGILTIPSTSQFEEATTLLVTDAGRVIVGGHRVSRVPFNGQPVSRADILLTRLTGSGDIDSAFGTLGQIIVEVDDVTGNVNDDNRIRQLLPTNDGGFLVIGSAAGEYVVAKRLANGESDTSFGGGDGSTNAVVSAGGVGSSGLDFATGATIGPDGSIVIVGRSESGNELGVVRLLADGLPDPSFGVRGVRFFTGVGFVSGGAGVSRDPNGGLVIATEFGQLVKLTETTVCPPAGCVQFSSISNEIAETSQTVEIRVARPSSTTEGIVTVDFFTLDGTATAGLDYTATSGTVTFGDNESSATISIPLLDDTIFEDDESFFVVLTNPTGGSVLGSQFVTPVVIEENDPSTESNSFFSFNSVTVFEDVGRANIRASVFPASRQPVTFDFLTVPTGSAVAGEDFVPVSQSFTIPAFTTSINIPINIILDDRVEATESFDVIVTGVQNARTSSNNRRTVAIQDVDPTVCDDGPGTLHPEFGENMGLTRVRVEPFDTQAGSADGPVFANQGSDGRVVQVGTLRGDDDGISVVRYNADGTLDDTFGVGGVASVPTVQNGGVRGTQRDSSEFPVAVRLLDDGKVLILGTGFNESDWSLFAIRLTNTGDLDSSFGTGGFSFTPLANPGTTVSDITFGDDGSAFVSGSVGVQWRSTPFDFYQGFVDQSTFRPIGFAARFGNAGYVLKLTPDGQFDPAFGDGGSRLFSQSSINDVKLDSNGRVLLTLTQSDAFQQSPLVRLNANGDLDTTLGSNGVIPISLPIPNDLFLPDGFTIDDVIEDQSVSVLTSSDAGIVVSVSVSYFVEVEDSITGTRFLNFVGFRFEIGLLDSDGVPVTSFGDNGFVATNDVLPDAGLSISDAAIQSNGQILLFGRTLGQLGGVRLRADGSLDQGYGGDGLARIAGASASFRGEIIIVEASETQTIVSFRDGNEFALAGIIAGEALGKVRLGGSAFNVAEDAGSFQLLVRRVCGVDGTISVQVNSANGSAQAGSDYQSVSQTVTFADGEFERIISIPILDNNAADGDRTFTVSLSNVSAGSEIVTVPTTTITIVDDEQPGRIEFVPDAIVVNETDGTAEIGVRRIDGDGNAVSATVSVTEGSATLGEDFSAPPATVSFAAGVSTATITVPIINDNIVESLAESFRLSLSNPTGGASLGLFTSIAVEIQDDDVIDRPPEGNFSLEGDVTVDEDAGTALITINRAEGSSGQATVFFSVTEGTANEGDDFRDEISQVVFADGETSRTFSVPILDDTLPESDETFNVTLTSVSAGRLDDSSNQITVTIADDDVAQAMLDFGDAPDSYGTSLATGGPNHSIVAGFSLGASNTAESDASPSAAASSDTGDDGITNLPASIDPGQTVSVNVTTSLPPTIGSAFLQGWIDANRDGTFGVDELVVDNFRITQSGTVSVPITLDDNAVTGVTYARFRLSTLGSIPPTGIAPDGEVEDYRLEIQGAPNTPPTVDAGGPYTVNEGASLQVQAVGNDAEDGTSLSYSWDFNFGGATFDLDATGRETQTPQLFDPPSSFVIAVRAADSGGLTATDTATVTINNLPPLVSADSMSVTIPDGQTGSLGGSFSDPGNDPVTIRSNVGTVTQSGGRFTWTGPSDAGRVTITATDDDAATATVSFTVIEQACSTIVSNTSDTGLGSLRSAIICSNDTAGIDEISFTIPGGSVILPESALPAITDAVVIQGIVGQPIVIDGSELPGGSMTDGLVIAANGRSEIDSIAVVNFPSDGIDVSTNDSIQLSRSYIGVYPMANSIGGNDGFGIVLRGSESLIGGSSALGNRIGNNEAGIVVMSPEGPDPTGNQIIGNQIGATTGSTSADFGNRLFGVYIDGDAQVVNENTIGGSDDGVRVSDGTGNRIENNTYIGLSGQEIDLDPNGPNVNDPGDSDEGANRQINTPAPEVTDIPGGVAVSFTFDSPTDTVRYPVTIEVSDVTQNGDIYTPRESVTIASGEAADFSFLLLPGIPSRLAAIAIDADGNTSEFSDPIVVRPPSGGSVPWLPGVDPLNPRSPLIPPGQSDEIRSLPAPVIGASSTRVDVGPLNLGIAVADSATGTGYLMYSEMGVHERFQEVHRANSDHLIAVRFHEGEWQYNNNAHWLAFEPEESDRLIAELDFDNDSANAMTGYSTSIEGINAGMVGGDLTIFGDQWNGQANDGEFEAEGTHFEFTQTNAISIAIGSLGSGVASVDTTTGVGYLMFSFAKVHDRFEGILPQNSDHLISVRFHNGTWQYGDNQMWRSFAPQPGDRLLAEIDFDQDLISPIEGGTGTYEGIASGYLRGDLSFIANRWHGVFNDGEFSVEGTRFDVPDSELMTVQLGAVNHGIGVTDNASGSGFILHSSESVHTRFADSTPLPGNSEHLIAVRYTGQAWQYNNNSRWEDFTPRDDDRLIAQVDFDFDEITSLQNDLGVFAGIGKGYVGSGLQFAPNQWNGQSNAGEFTVSGKSFVVPVASGTPYQLGRHNAGIAVADNATGEGYLMYSEESVHVRFVGQAPHPGNSDHLIAVRTTPSGWQYNDNSRWVDFVPVDSDRLLATVDFSGDEVQSLQGVVGEIDGIKSGYDSGDLLFFANRWGGATNAGEFDVQGTYFYLAPTEPDGPGSGGTAGSESNRAPRISVVATNPGIPLATRLDVSGTNGVTALDALLIINMLASGENVADKANQLERDEFLQSYDVNQDGDVTTRDALHVINALSAADGTTELEELDPTTSDYWEFAVDEHFRVTLQNGTDEEDELDQETSVPSLF